VRVVSIVGARPQFVKAAAVGRALRVRHEEVLVHTGQHYDHRMSQVFFDELGLPAPDINLGVGSASHGRQTGAMLSAVEDVLLERRPDWVLVYGDTNSTLAGALAAAKLAIRVAHVEAGLRGFNRGRPEEINRVLTDHVSDLLLCPSARAAANLEREGIRGSVEVVGDVMADVLAWALARTGRRPPPLPPGKTGEYYLATVHRAENTDRRERLTAILRALEAAPAPVLFPVHPRARRALATAGLRPGPTVHLVEPLGYFDLVAAAQGACAILTDSGGLQKEAYWLGVPCVTLRDETEWIETVEHGWNRLVGADTARILDALSTLQRPHLRPSLYGDGEAAQRTVAALERHPENGAGSASPRQNASAGT
jgi:UDP-GlcNAc3NAcA epimerase